MLLSERDSHWLYYIIKGTHYTRYYDVKEHFYKNLVEGGRTFQGDLLIEDSALNEVVRYSKSNIHRSKLSYQMKILIEILHAKNCLISANYGSYKGVIKREAPIKIICPR